MMAGPEQSPPPAPALPSPNVRQGEESAAAGSPDVLLRRWGIALVLSLAVGLLILFQASSLHGTNGRWGVPLDDAWIHFQFARNLAGGHGFSYNPGIATPGSTAPLWTLILALPACLFADPVRPGIILSAVFFLVSVWLTYRLALELSDHRPAALLAALGVVLAGRMLWAGLSAMETTLFAALTLAGVWSYQRRGLAPLTALILALASQARPEGHLLFALAVIAALTNRRAVTRGTTPSEPATTRRDLLLALAIYALVNLPYVLFSLSVTGRPLPNTFYAKSGGGDLYSLRALAETLAIHWRDNPVASTLALAGLIPLWRRSRLAAAWLVTLILLLPFIIPFVWHHGRYSLPLIPFQMIAAALGAVWLVDRFPRRRAAAAAIVLFTVILAGGLTLPSWSRMLGDNSREILEVDLAMGAWLGENLPAGSVVAVDDIGAITYLSERPIVDLIGLVSPEMWPALNDEEPVSATVRLLAESGVETMAIFPGWHGLLAGNADIARPVARFQASTHTIIAEPEAVVYSVDWPYRAVIDPQNPVDAGFGERIRLRGYDLSPVTIGQTATVDLYWEALADIIDDYKVFIHLMDPNSAIIAQSDAAPAAGFAPTFRWLAGDLIRDRHRLQLPADLPAGDYRLYAGLYDVATLARLPADAPETSADAVFLGTISLP